MKILGLLISLTALLSGDTIYSVTNLGSWGGSSSMGYQINDSGSVIGWAETVAGVQQAFQSPGGGPIQPLSFPSASDSYAYGINGSGAIVGTSYVNGQPHGTVWTGSGVTDLGAGIYAMGINNAGVIIGSNGHAFKLQNGAYQDLGALPGGDWSSAYGINDAGTVVGYGDLASGLFRGIVWDPSGSLIELGTLGGANSYATGVNDSGEVIGHSGVSSGYDHAFLAIAGVLTDLGTLSGGCSFAYGINDSGSIVGYSWSDTEDNPRAFLYTGGAMLDLNSLIPAGSGWQLLAAYGINGAGDIVGTGLFNGQPSAFLLDPPAGSFGADADPVPEPDSLAAAAVALIVLALVARAGHRTSTPPRR
ncbi:MAG: HAF repeat-containing protein [Acidobacteriia bacterium]|nr:HAF repeat-containing protein [Terriglobia bacterium]